MLDSNIKSLLLDETIQFKVSKNNNEKYISISNQIELKSKLSFKNKNLSSDIKQCISYHFKSLEENEIHYDQINITLLFGFIEQTSLDEKILLTQYLIRIIKKYGYEDFVEFSTQKLNNYERQNLKTKKGLFASLKKFHLFCITSLTNSFLILILIYILFSLILLPSPYPSMNFFKISYVDICDNFYLNHWCNTIGGLFGLFEDFKIIPNNIIALIIMIIGKLFFILFIVNIVLNQITKNINK